MSAVVGVEDQPTRIEVQSSPWDPVLCVCHGMLRTMQMEDYPLNLQGRNWIIAGIYVSRCSVDPNNVEEVFQDPKAGQEALDKIFEMCFPERAALKGIVF